MRTRPSHICIVCSRLDLQGGIERASVNLANLFVENGHMVTILILDVTKAVFYPVDQRITIVQKALHFGITPKGHMLSRKLQFTQHCLRLRKIYKKIQADVIITTEYSLTIPTWLSTRGYKTPVVGWEHHHFYWMKKSAFWQFLFRFIYPKLNAVVCQNSKEKELFEAIGCRAVVIPYVVPQQELPATLQSKTILTIGWLIKRKGVDLIPAIAQKIFKNYPDWTWKIIGEGEEYGALQKEIEERDSGNNIIIQKPASPDIEKEYRSAAFFTLLSRFECLPLVLLEATTFGVPCIAFDCPTGPADIITDGIDGYLVPLEDIEAMASAMEQLMNNQDRRKEFGQNAHRNSKRYSPETIYQKWIELFERIRN